MALTAGVKDRMHGSSVDDRTKFLIEDIIEIFGGFGPFLNAHVLIIKIRLEIRAFRLL
jgi:hypothetical protein